MSGDICGSTYCTLTQKGQIGTFKVLSGMLGIDVRYFSPLYLYKIRKGRSPQWSGLLGYSMRFVNHYAKRTFFRQFNPVCQHFKQAVGQSCFSVSLHHITPLHSRTFFYSHQLTCLLTGALSPVFSMLSALIQHIRHHYVKDALMKLYI